MRKCENRKAAAPRETAAANKLYDQTMYLLTIGILLSIAEISIETAKMKTARIGALIMGAKDKADMPNFLRI